MPRPRTSRPATLRWRNKCLNPLTLRATVAPCIAGLSQIFTDGRQPGFPRGGIQLFMIPAEPKGLCTSCNRAVELDAKVCPHCNAPLDTGGTQPLDVPREDTSGN